MTSGKVGKFFVWMSARSLLRKTEPCEDLGERVPARGNHSAKALR